jgi:hypothetical protein
LNKWCRHNAAFSCRISRTDSQNVGNSAEHIKMFLISGRIDPVITFSMNFISVRAFFTTHGTESTAHFNKTTPTININHQVESSEIRTPEQIGLTHLASTRHGIIPQR